METTRSRTSGKHNSNTNYSWSQSPSGAVFRQPGLAGHSFLRAKEGLLALPHDQGLRELAAQWATCCWMAVVLGVPPALPPGLLQPNRSWQKLDCYRLFYESIDQKSLAESDASSDLDSTHSSEGSWTAERSAQLYSVKGWGSPYFSVSEEGRLCVRPQGGAKLLQPPKKRTRQDPGQRVCPPLTPDAHV